MVKIENVVKKYANNNGIFDVSIHLKAGDIYALIGPKGAGKTTLIRATLGLIKKDSGVIYVNGVSSWKETNKIMNMVGYLSALPSIPSKMTGEHFISFIASSKDRIDNVIIERLAAYFNLDLTKKIKELTKEEYKLISLIVAIMHDPICLFLDDPYTDLSPINKKRLNILLLKLAEERNKTIMISSTDVNDVFGIANKYGFLKVGFISKEINVNRGAQDRDVVMSTYKNVYYEETYKDKSIFDI